MHVDSEEKRAWVASCALGDAHVSLDGIAELEKNNT